MKKVIIVLVFLLIFTNLVTAIEIDSCQVIDEEGEYILTEDIETDENCFRITANDVTLDCNEHSITGPDNAYGIILGSVNGITISNCEISGFGQGINLENSNSNTIRDNTVNENGIGIYLDDSDSNNINNNLFCYNDYFDVRGGRHDEFIDNQCGIIDHIYNEYVVYNEDEGSPFVECIPCDLKEHEIRLRRGWNLISSYLVPEDLNIRIIFNELVEEGSLILVKDEQSRFYRPDRDFNNIPEWNPQEAYYVKVNEGTTLVIEGYAYTPNRLELEQGWNYVAYPLTEAMDMNDVIENILSPLIEEDILDIVKNDLGNFFVPRLNFNNIREMRPGEGYMVKVSEDVTLDFSNHNSVIENGVKYYIEVDKFTYRLRDDEGNRENVKMLFKITNLRDNNVRFGFYFLEHHHFEARDEDGALLWYIPIGGGEYINGFTLHPGESWEFRTIGGEYYIRGGMFGHWDLVDVDDWWGDPIPVEPGTYEVIGSLNPFGEYLIEDEWREDMVPVSVFVDVVEE